MKKLYLTLLVVFGSPLGPASAQTLTAPRYNGATLTDAQSLGNRFSLDSMATCNSTMQVPVKSNICVRLAAPNEEAYAINLGLTSNTPTGDKVTLYTGAHALAGSSTMWARNALLQVDPGSKGGHVDEIDFNNAACAVGDADHPNLSCTISAIGLLTTGLPNPYIAGHGIMVTTGTGELWQQGLSFAGDSVKYADIWEETGASYIMKANGAHNYGLDFTAATFGGNAINFNAAKKGQSIIWNQGSATTGQYGIYGAADGSALLMFAPSGVTKLMSDGSWQMPGNIDSTGTITGQTVRATGGLFAPQHMPASSNSPCTPGQITSDANYIAWCNGPNHWLRVAGSTF